MLDMQRLAEVAEALKAMPEVTKEEALAAFVTICGRYEKHSPELLQILCEVAGNAISTDEPEMTRRLLVWERDNGPITSP